MNKRLKFSISISLIFAIFVSCFCIPASSFENDVETSTADMLLINTDTDTVVFSQKPDNMWYAGTLAELMTFLLAHEAISAPDTVAFKVEQSFISALPYTDGCLNRFVGQTLTATDLMEIMLLTSGSDAAYALADLASGGDRKAFISAMNERADALGMTNTGYVSPGFDNTSDHYTTCRDLYTLYKAVDEVDLYHEMISAKSYVPAGLSGEEYTVTAEASILNENSPYYFRYVNDAQFSYTEDTYAGIVLTTTYRGMTYFYAGLLGLNESERNVYADARKLTTWAYLNLSDRKMINAEDTVSGVTVQADWGEYKIELHPLHSAFKTLPNDYDEDKISYTFDIPASVQIPLLDGQTIGKAKLSYDGNEIDDIELIVNSDEGLDMISDFARFGNYVFHRVMPVREETSATEPADADETAEPAEEAATAAADNSAATAATEG